MSDVPGGTMTVDAAPRPARSVPNGWRPSAAALKAVSEVSRRHSGSGRRATFSLVILRGDGERVLRFNFARPAALGVAVSLALSVSLVGLLLGDWLKLRELTREAVTFANTIAQQRATIEATNHKIALLRTEVAGWREMHARIQEPFGPEAGRGSRDRGIGGATTGPERFATIAPADELQRLSETIKEEGDNLRSLDRLMARASKALATLPSRWPVRGSVNSEFGRRPSPWTQSVEFHSGIDIRAQMGTPVHAPAAGTVVVAGAAHEYGTAVMLDHGHDIKTLYGHLSKISVKVGEKVERGTLLAFSGNTGRSSGPHLHYEIFVKGQPVNPRAYLWD
ncbi:MAG TPA: M23 family metallopeptidase [Methylomirabilota bacterium]|jgi:murein DD-endopeptidase MepM/ murein hydrolase activator NlpD|nr:M23 family metallopeptidase [Methylomirabilota bacterium]